MGTIRESIAQLEKLRDVIDSGAEAGLHDLVDHGVEVARRLSSGSEITGNLSQADLNRMDNPYARRHGRPRLQPGIINMQRGVFYAAWKSAVLGGNYAKIVNDSDVADFLQFGTEFMFERPIAQLVEQRLAETVLGILVPSIQKALGQ